MNLRHRQIHPNTPSRAPPEIQQPFPPLRFLGPEPARGVERVGRGECGGVVVQVGGGHADGGVGGDCPVVVGEGDGVHALEAVEGAVGEAEAFVYDGGEVGEGFEIVGWRRVGGVRDCGAEFVEESGEDGGVGEDVVGC